MVPKAADCPKTGWAVTPPPKTEGVWDVPKFWVACAPNAGGGGLVAPPNKEVVLGADPKTELLPNDGFDPNTDPVLVVGAAPKMEFPPVELKLPPNGFPVVPNEFPPKTLEVEEVVVAPSCGGAKEKFDGFGAVEAPKAVSCPGF